MNLNESIFRGITNAELNFVIHDLLFTPFTGIENEKETYDVYCVFKILLSLYDNHTQRTCIADEKKS